MLESGFRLYRCQLPFEAHQLKQHAHVQVLLLLWFWSYRVEIQEP